MPVAVGVQMPLSVLIRVAVPDTDLVDVPFAVPVNVPE